MTMSDHPHSAGSAPAELILCRLGEITLKGLNRRQFEDRIQQNLRRRLRPLGDYRVGMHQSRIRIRPRDEAARERLPRALERAATVFGLVSVSPAVELPGTPELEMLKQGALDYVAALLRRQPRYRRFKVESRRGDKRFPLTSPQMSAELGRVILEANPQLHVDVHEPDFVLYVELRDEVTLYHEIIEGSRGLPIGSSGRAMLLLSGGIDSPVAGYMMASRGLRMEAIYFHTHPYTSDQALDKVRRLADELSVYSGRLPLHVVDFTETQMTLNAEVPGEMLTVVMRRVMLRVADRLARARDCGALVTGESLGQVASQTLAALACTNEVTQLPIFRPLIGMDKDATIAIAREIGTFETSILPYDDCCTIFVAKHPRIHPTLEHAARAEAGLDIDALVERTLEGIELEVATPDRL